MKNRLIIVVTFFCCSGMYAQKAPTSKEPAVPCNGTADNLPGKYTDHTNPKYPSGLKASSAAEKTAMLNQLIALEKLEEKSRSNFQLAGCVARVSFSNLTNGTCAGYAHKAYSYQLAVYQNVCHITEHVVKTVDEYRTVFRVNVNQPLVYNNVQAGGTGEFYLSDKSVRYEIPVHAKQGPGYTNDKEKSASRISTYISESMVLANRSDNYKNKHADFLKIINGDGYVESWLNGTRDDKPNPKAYKWVDRHYLITRRGIPVLIPVSRKQFLEDLLEYLEIEKANFYYDLDKKLKDNAGNTSDYAKKRAAILAADKDAYPPLYEAKKARVKQLLATQSADWLQMPAVVDYNSQSYDANQRLADIGKFYDAENEYRAALYIFNPAYFKNNADQPVKPLLMEIQFRYELGEERGFSERLFNNFLKNYDMDTLRKMVE